MSEYTKKPLYSDDNPVTSLVGNSKFQDDENKSDLAVVVQRLASQTEDNINKVEKLINKVDRQDNMVYLGFIVILLMVVAIVVDIFLSKDSTQKELTNSINLLLLDKHLK
jgi:hypothetical protein